MAFKKFQTQQADYTFFAINHIWNRLKPQDLEGLDVLVTETNAFRSDKLVQDGFAEKVTLTVSRNFAHRETIEHIRNSIPLIYSVDVDTTGEQDYTSLHVKKVSDYYKLLQPGIAKGEISDEYVERITSVHMAESHPIINGRSLFAAKKLEDGLTPKLVRMHKKRPHIGILYGSSHLDMITFLQDAELREEWLETYRSNDFKGLNKLDFTQLTQYQYFPPSHLRSVGFWKPKTSKLKISY